MALNLILTLLINVVVVLSRVRLAEGRSFNVSVPENATVGTEVVGVRHWLGMQKAELPCVKTEGDPYGRFLLTKECTLVVANPLDWSVRSEYTIKIRVGDRREVRSVSIQVTDVPGYPPVYNETCETPINPTGKDTGEYLFKYAISAEAETGTGDVLEQRYERGKPYKKWKKPHFLHVLDTESSNCQLKAIWALHALNDLIVAEQLWSGQVRNVTCRGDLNYDPKLFIQLLDPDVQKYRRKQDFPSYINSLKFIVMLTLSFPLKSTLRYKCNVPKLGGPVRTERRPNLNHNCTCTVGRCGTHSARLSCWKIWHSLRSRLCL